jgi:hypothetical protein
MIVPSMNLAEIKREINRDMPAVDRNISQQVKQLRKSWCFRFSKDHHFAKDYYSTKKNHWIFFHHFSSKETVSYAVVYFYTEAGITAMSRLSMMNDYVLMFNGHFLQRYNERLNLQLVKPEDILKHYCLNNQNFVFETSREFESKNMNVFSVLPSGIALGFRNDEDRVIQFKTFLSENMLYANQKEKVIHIRKTEELNLKRREEARKLLALFNTM